MNSAPITIVFFGSFLEYSSYVLESLLSTKDISVLAVVTTQPIIDKKGEHKNPTHMLANTHEIPVLTPQSLTVEQLNSLTPVDFFVTAGYGKLLPPEWLAYPTHASLNLHLSYLPDYRGANPGEWALLRGETTSGVTLIEMSPKFDTGTMVAQLAIPIESDDTRETLYTKLYKQGAAVLPEWIIRYHSVTGHSSPVTSTDSQDITNLKAQSSNLVYYNPPKPQPAGDYFYARRINRDDGFVEWSIVQAAMNGETITEEQWPSLFVETVTGHRSLVTGADNQSQLSTKYPVPSTTMMIDRASRALAGFPSLWTIVPTSKGEKRMKIVSTNVRNRGNEEALVLETVQIEGKQVARWNEVKNQVINS